MKEHKEQVIKFEKIDEMKTTIGKDNISKLLKWKKTWIDQ